MTARTAPRLPPPRRTPGRRRPPASRTGRMGAPAPFRRRPSPRALAEAVRALAVMVGARLPLVDALDAAARQARAGALLEALAGAARRVRRGAALSDALAADPAAFGPLLPRVARVGEASGTLGPSLLRVAGHLERAAALRRKVALALVYPALVLTVAAGAVAFLLTFVVPTFAELFADAGAPLPAPTRVVIALSDGLRDHGLLLGAAGAGAVLAVRAWTRTERGGVAWDGWALRAPVVGPLAAKGLAARFARTLSTLVGSGVPLVDALAVAEGAAGNRALAAALGRSRRSVVRGGALAPSLGASGVVPPLLVQMVGVGEATGDLDGVLAHAADHFEREVDASVDALTSVIEPVLIVLLGAIVGGVLVAIYLPMFDLVTVLE